MLIYVKWEKIERQWDEDGVDSPYLSIHLISIAYNLLNINRRIIIYSKFFSHHIEEFKQFKNLRILRKIINN